MYICGPHTQIMIMIFVMTKAMMTTLMIARSVVSSVITFRRQGVNYEGCSEAVNSLQPVICF